MGRPWDTHWVRHRSCLVHSARIIGQSAHGSHPPFQDVRLPADELEAATSRVTQALAQAHRARSGLPAEMQALVRAYAHAHRVAGSDFSAVLVEVKSLVQDHSGSDEIVFMTKIVGWTVAGYFAGTGAARGDPGARE